MIYKKYQPNLYTILSILRAFSLWDRSGIIFIEALTASQYIAYFQDSLVSIDFSMENSIILY